jgi:hypothetical protein
MVTPTSGFWAASVMRPEIFNPGMNFAEEHLFE